MNNKIIISRISGGLGNQMFQYAIGRNLAIKNKIELVLDTSFFQNNKTTDTRRDFTLGYFNCNFRKINNNDERNIELPNMCDLSLFGKIKRKIFRLKENLKPLNKKIFITEPSFVFHPEILEIKNGCYLSGVWQTEKYFKDIENIIRKEFTLKDKPTPKTEEWIKKIEKSNSVSLHIRRGDYVSNTKTNQFHGICDVGYYLRAVKIISEKIKNPEFFIFSDDIEWAKNNLKINFPTYFVSDKNIPDYEELIIMSRCRHNIIANSSFSWWGAWLNENKNKIVIAPQQWFNSTTNTKDLIPENWMRI
ncbi:MAG: alpha-1,2-fucosyltransferase [bacterium]